MNQLKCIQKLGEIAEVAVGDDHLAITVTHELKAYVDDHTLQLLDMDVQHAKGINQQDIKITLTNLIVT